MRLVCRVENNIIGQTLLNHDIARMSASQVFYTVGYKGSDYEISQKLSVYNNFHLLNTGRPENKPGTHKMYVPVRFETRNLISE